MKTLKGIIGTETSVVSMVKFTGSFDIIFDDSKCIRIKCFSINNAKTIYKNFGDDCTDAYKEHLMYNLMFSEVDEDGYVKFLLDVESDFSFDTSIDDYMVVSIITTKNTMKIIKI